MTRGAQRRSRRSSSPTSEDSSSCGRCLCALSQIRSMSLLSPVSQLSSIRRGEKELHRGLPASSWRSRQRRRCLNKVAEDALLAH